MVKYAGVLWIWLSAEIKQGLDTISSFCKQWICAEFIWTIIASHREKTSELWKSICLFMNRWMLVEYRQIFTQRQLLYLHLHWKLSTQPHTLSLVHFKGILKVCLMELVSQLSPGWINLSNADSVWQCVCKCVFKLLFKSFLWSV